MCILQTLYYICENKIMAVISRQNTKQKSRTYILIKKLMKFNNFFPLLSPGS